MTDANTPNPWGPQGNDPLEAPKPQTNEWSAANDNLSAAQPPVEPAPQPVDPYGTPQANPYGAPSDPYAAQQANPYGAPADPYNQAGQLGGAAYPQTGYNQATGYPQAGYYTQGPVLASWGKRFQGYLLDWLLPGFVLGLLSFFLLPGGETNTTNGGFSATSTNPLQQWLPFLIIATALAFLNKNGQTPGRRWAGTQLVNEQGQPVQAGGASLGRYLLHILDNLCFLGWLWPLWDQNRQTFADKIMKTRVIDLKASGIDPNQPRQF